MIRIYHPYWKWECWINGMYSNTSTNEFRSDPALMYAEFLSDSNRFEKAIINVLDKWPISCQQFLTNSSFNRIAWIGQASMCISTKVPRKYRYGFNLLSSEQKNMANNLAERYLKLWLQSLEK